jgi:hypothetical protein
LDGGLLLLLFLLHGCLDPAEGLQEGFEEAICVSKKGDRMRSWGTGFSKWQMGGITIDRLTLGKDRKGADTCNTCKLQQAVGTSNPTIHSTCPTFCRKLLVALQLRRPPLPPHLAAAAADAAASHCCPCLLLQLLHPAAALPLT